MRKFTDSERRIIKRDQSIRIFENDQYVVIIPKTYLAMQIYGANTTWCFNTDDENIFESYSEQGPLFVIIIKNDQKYVLHLETDGLKDQNCQSLSHEFFELHTILQDLFLNIITSDKFKTRRNIEKYLALQIIGYSTANIEL